MSQGEVKNPETDGRLKENGGHGNQGRNNQGNQNRNKNKRGRK